MWDFNFYQTCVKIIQKLPDEFDSYSVRKLMWDFNIYQTCVKIIRKFPDEFVFYPVKKLKL